MIIKESCVEITDKNKKIHKFCNTKKKTPENINEFLKDVNSIEEVSLYYYGKYDEGDKLRKISVDTINVQSEQNTTGRHVAKKKVAQLIHLHFAQDVNEIKEILSKK